MSIKIVSLIAFSLLAISCVADSSEKKGVDHKGVERSCEPMKLEGVACTEIFTEADAFGLKCKQDGHEAIQCGCHDWICIKK